MEEHSNTYDVYMEFENEDKMSMVIKKLREEDILISNVVIIKKRSKTQSVVIQATMEAAKWKARHTVFREVRQQEGLFLWRKYDREYNETYHFLMKLKVR